MVIGRKVNIQITSIGHYCVNIIRNNKGSAVDKKKKKKVYFAVESTERIQRIPWENK